MPTLLLIRHGETDYVKKKQLPGRLPGIHLNARGRKQAAALAESLKDVPLAAIYSSPLERALETAEPIATTRSLPVQQAAGLVETDIGDWQGARLKRLSKLPEWKLVQRAPSRFRFPGGESFSEQQSRIIAEVERIAHQHENDQLAALVFHADPIKLVMAYYLGMPLDLFQRLACGTGSVSALMLTDSSAILLRMNVVPPFSFAEVSTAGSTKKTK